MADFGLAAQVGRGGGGGGMPQQQDPQNRMMQMMQLQQLQQNMMLARDQEARQAQLFGPQLEGKRLENITEAQRQGLLGAQAREATAKAGGAEDALFGQRGVLKYIGETPKELIADPKNLDTLRRTNSAAYTTITRMIAENDALQNKARTEKYTAGQKLLEQQNLARKNMFSLLPAVTNQNEYDTLYSDYEGVDPVGSKLIGRKFDPKNMAALSSRLMALDEAEIKEDAFGRPYRVFKRTGQTEMVPVPPSAATAIPITAPAAPAASAFGNLNATAPALPQMDGAGATPIIGQRAPAALSPELGPAAAAASEKKTAELRATDTVAGEARKKGVSEVLKALDNPEIEKLIQRSTSGIVERGLGFIPRAFGQSTSGMEAIGQLDTISGDLTLRLLNGKLGAGISNNDVELVKKTLADIANTLTPANERLAAYRQLKKNLESIVSGKPIEVVPGSATNSAVDKSNPLLGDMPFRGR